MTTRTKYYVYGSKYRFLVQEANALGHSKSATFDDWTGLMTSQTDVNYLTTTYQYDALGRLTDVTRPDRTEHHISYNWNNVSAFSNAVYYTSETEVGQPEAKTYYDVLGRAIHTYVAGRGYDDVVYNDLGLVSKTTYVPYSTPSTALGSKTWHTNNYDNYNRIVSETDPYTNLSYSYYDYNNPTMHEYFVTVTDNIRNTNQTKKYDAVGRVTQVIDEGGTINYTYSYQTEGGKIRDKMSISVGGNTTTIKSDIRGNRLSIQDPDAGTVTSTYDVLNQLVTRTDANLNQTAYTYDLIGRTTQIVYSKGTESETITYTYDNATGSGMGKLASVKKNGSNDCIFVYDDLGRLSNRKVYDGHTVYNHQYEYNNLGQLQYFTYPDSYCIENVYNSYGELKQIKNAADNSLIYAADSRNKFRQPLKCRYGNETGVQYTYNAYGMLTGIKNGDVVGNYNVNGVGIDMDDDVNYSINNQYRQLTYSYNDRGFIDSRTDAKVNQSETYTYDNLDRLTSYTVNGTTAASFTYGNTGNILTNSKVGTYSYGNSKPHAVSDIACNSSCPISASQCDVTYNLRNKPTAIAENGYRITLDYDAAGMRRHTRYYQGNTMQKATAKISDVYEFELGSGAQRKLDYIYAEGQLVAVHVKRGTADSLYYVMTDHLGSWNKVMDEDKNIVQQTHFDPWGNRMSYTAWNTPQTQTTFSFSRGYTGHEHYDRFKIINANARLYDPVIGRFFSPDPFVQAPDFTQNYNRYSYCMNNPVMYSDPDGEFVIVDSWIVGFVSKFFQTGSLKQSWQEANKRAGNDAKLWGGLLVTDENKSFWGRAGEFVSRFTWQLPQTLLGWIVAESCNTLGFGGGVESVDYAYGATVTRTNNCNWGAVTLGNYITGDNSIRANANNSLFQHEYGHYLQSQEMGLAYLPRVCVPSILSSHDHDFHPVEQDANRRAFLYFNRYVDGFYKSKHEMETYRGWDFDNNPLNIDHSNISMQYVDYHDEQSLQLLDKLAIHAKWYDYACWMIAPFGPVAVGLYNAMYYNAIY